MKLLTYPSRRSYTDVWNVRGLAHDTFCLRLTARDADVGAGHPGILPDDKHRCHSTLLPWRQLFFSSRSHQDHCPQKISVLMSPPQSMPHALLLIATAICISWTNAQDVQHDDFALTAINSAAPDSNSFALVNSTTCDDLVTAKIYEIYTQNAMVFQTCVVQGQFGIFPFSGAYPTTKQIGDMGRSLACRAIFLAVLLAGIPECNFSGFPLRAAAETELKISMDMEKYPTALNVIPSTDRFIHLMLWRRNVNLANAAGLPCDSNSKLYSEFAGNLYTLTTNGLVRLTAEMKIEYRLTVDGSFSQDEIALPPYIPGQSSSGSATGIIVVGGESPILTSDSGSGGMRFTKRQRTAADIPAKSASVSGADQLLCWGKFQTFVVASIFALSAFEIALR